LDVLLLDLRKLSLDQELFRSLGYINGRRPIRHRESLFASLGGTPRHLATVGADQPFIHPLELPELVPTYESHRLLLCLERYGGRTLGPPPSKRNLWVLDRQRRGDLVEGRVGNLVGIDLRSPLNELRQQLHDLRIGLAAVGLCVLGTIPQADSERLRTACGHEGDLVLKSLLL